MADLARILIAAPMAGQNFLVPCLMGYEISTAETFTQAIRLLSDEAFDLVVCSIHFDDSRAVNLLQEIRKDPNRSKTPFIVSRTMPSEHRQLLRLAVETIEKAFGAIPYIELDSYKGSPDPVAAMRVAIEKHLPPEKIVGSEGKAS
jgi:CheY-like chemotaxis protein